MKKFPTALASLALTAALAGGNFAAAEQMDMMADLKASEEVPPVDSAATGMTEIEYDSATRKLSWELEYMGLSGEATAAHFHGPAAPGENAPPVITIDKASGSEGSADLTEAQAADLEAGKWYVNVHTAANKSGEIRGQVMPSK